MIQNKIELNILRSEWASVRAFQSKIQRHLNASSIGIGSGGSTHELRNISHNLTLLFAFSVLEKALKQMKIEGLISAKRDSLGALMSASRNHISWLDYPLVDQARGDRNLVAHEQQLIERGTCWCYLDAIEAELVAWQVLSGPIPFKH
ncbi:MAG: hypothetical protein KDE28_04995 [Anaerolineales bacterium]|nr:hypothetical protein [Anaerolineales bacterium]